MKFHMMKFLHTLQEEAGDGTGGGASGGADNGGDGGGDGGELLAGKYENQDALIAGYTELNTAFSAKDELHKAELAKYGAPEAYTPKEDWANDNSDNNRMMAILQDVGKEVGLSQEGYEAMFDGITEMQTRVADEALTETIKSIPNFETRANNMQDIALKHLRPDQAQAMDKLMTTKESFEAVEVLMSALRGGVLPSNVAPPAQATEAQIRTDIANLNPADTKERARLMKVVNERNEGQGKLI